MRGRAALRLRGLTPLRIAARRAEARGRATWEQRPEKRERVLATMDAIVGGTARAGDLEMLARRHVIETETYETAFWRPWRDPAIDAISSARLRAALARDRGVLLSTCHLGPFFLTMALIASLGRTPYAVVAPWFFEQPGEDEWARRLDRWWEGISRRGERVVSSVGSFPVLRALLEQGEIVYLFFDMPGSRETRFLGKPVMLATGSARLAIEADAQILPIRARREGHRVWADVAEPLDPRDFADAEELHDALAAVHERWILETPESLEDPRRPGSWEEAATARGWARPQPPPAAS